MADAVPLMDLARLHEPLAEELRGAFDRVLGASSFILGDEVELFEAEFAAYCGVEQCVGIASGTAALSIMLEAAGIGRGDEVIVPAHTFIATATSVIQSGAKPVCVDVDPGTGLIDPAAVRAAIGPRTAAIIAVHLYGQTCAMEELACLAEGHALKLFEDAAQAHGATFRGARAGGLGDAAAFSFYPSKNLGALGDAGAICTSDQELAMRARRLRDLGRGDTPIHSLPGYNERLDGLQAAVLRVKLPYLEEWNAARRDLAAHYREQLDEDLELLHETPDSPCVYHLFPVRARNRASLASGLKEWEIGTGVHYPKALVDQPALHDLVEVSDVPAAQDWAARELSLPLFPDMTESEAELVVHAVSEFRRHPSGFVCIVEEASGRHRGVPQQRWAPLCATSVRGTD